MTEDARMWEYRRFSLEERDRRWNAVRALMERDGVDVIIAPPNSGHSTDWQADTRYLTHCGGGADTDVAAVFPLVGEPAVIAKDADVRWGPLVQNWMSDRRDAYRHFGRGIAEKLNDLGADGKRIGITGLSSPRAPEGSILMGTYKAIVEAVPNSEIVDATDLLQEVRCVKSQEEIDVLQASVDLIERAVEAELVAGAKPGIRDYEVWAAAMSAMLAGGGELSMHFNWVAEPFPKRTLTRPTMKVLEDGDVIDNELEASIIGYRAQQKRPVAIRTCDPIYFDLVEFHGELYERLLDFIKPGVTLAEAVEKTRQLGEQLCPRGGPLAGGGADLHCHGRGLGDDVPLATNKETIARYGDWTFPENGVFIIKPGVRAGSMSKYRFSWGDTCRTTPKGTVRMGKSPHSMLIAR
ncbi:MAG: family metallopeptidase [Chloroflexi bacterium]|nr:family metallopeptidase [Chloroflexota bacterium]